MDKKLDYLIEPLQLAHGKTVHKYIIPEEDKKLVLEELYPFDPIPDLDAKMYDLHADKYFIVREFLVVWQDGYNFLVSPYYPESGGSVIDWIDETQWVEEEESDDFIIDDEDDLFFIPDPYSDPGPRSLREFCYNPNYRRRDELLGLAGNIWEKGSADDIIRFDNLTLPVLETLLEEKFIDPDQRQNYSPSVSEFLGYMKKHPSSYAMGYAVSPYRSDYRVSLEGLFIPHKYVTAEVLQDFSEFCENADKLEIKSSLYGWWD